MNEGIILHYKNMADVHVKQARDLAEQSKFHLERAEEYGNLVKELLTPTSSNN